MTLTSYLVGVAICGVVGTIGSVYYHVNNETNRYNIDNLLEPITFTLLGFVCSMAWPLVLGMVLLVLPIYLFVVGTIWFAKWIRNRGKRQPPERNMTPSTFYRG